MSIQKKSLIANREAAKKAIVAKEATDVKSNFRPAPKAMPLRSNIKVAPKAAVAKQSNLRFSNVRLAE